MNLRNRERWSNDLLTALAPILPQLEDDGVTEIEVIDFDHVRVKGPRWKGHHLIEGAGWSSPQMLKVACSSVAEITERVVNEENPLFDGRLPGGERINIVVPPCSPSVFITIRKFPKEAMSIEKLLEYGSINEDVANMLRGLVTVRKNIMVAGGTESGKTSLLNAMSRLISNEEKPVTVEDARELQMQNPIWQATETLKAWKKGMKEVKIADLVVNTLRMSPDRIIVDEVRGEEALYLLRAFSTGHSGGMGTVHSNSAADALDQLQLLASFANVGGVSGPAIAGLVARAIDIVIYVKKFEEDGSRRITQIIEVDRPRGVVISPNGEAQYRYRILCQFKSTGYDGENQYGRPKIKGHWEFPHCPSPELKRSIQYRLGKEMAWPQASLESSDEVVSY